MTFLVVFLTGAFLHSALTTIYATVSLRAAPDSRATAVGRTSGPGRLGAVFGPWLGGRLLAGRHGDRGFTAFALRGVSSMVFIGIAALRTRQASPSDTPRELLTAHRSRNGSVGRARPARIRSQTGSYLSQATIW
ncbi:hypothetical protein AB0D09_16205 [Streptomyces sp. NPDC049097]|uniref:hypothetical protein n=1 Tax=Streptomyces sp. NPDC049097 TaxID=3155497 RepID=UPI0034445457